MVLDPYMGFAYPVDHDSNDVWGALINTALGTIGAHDHSAGKGKQVPTGGIGINADLTFASFAATNLKAVDFAAIAASAVTGYAGALFMSDGTGGLSANELYWRTTSGSNVKVTNGATLNVGVFTGGIVGDYAGVAAVAAYDDAGKRYTWKESAADSNGWARMAHGEMRLLPTGGVGAFYVGQAAPGALAGNYTLTWPLVLPAAAQTVSIDNTGAIALGAAQSLAVNNSFTLSGTGDVKHGTRTASITFSSFVSNNGTADYTNSKLNFTAGPYSVAVPLRTTKRISAIRVTISDSVTGPTKLLVDFFSKTGGGGIGAVIASSVASAGDGSLQTLSITGLATTITAGTYYWIQVRATTGGAACAVWYAEIDYDRP